MTAQKTGLLIKEKRQEKKMTQLQLAMSLHVTATAVSKWERGLNLPDMQNMKPLSELLDIPLTELLPDDMLTLMCEPASNTESPNTDDIPQSEVSATDDSSSPKPKTSSPSNCPEKTGWKVIVVSLLCVLLLGTAATACWMKPMDKTPSFTVVDEYYDDYEGQKAYYILVEYTKEPTDDDYDRTDFSFRISHADYFEDASFIIVIYYKRGDYDKDASDLFVSASFYTFLLPRPSLETPKGAGS